MSRTTITATVVPDTGYNLTDSADFATLSTGSGNGVQFTYNPANRLVLKNDTGGAAVFTIKVPTPGQYSGQGATIPDVTKSVATGKTVLYPLSAIFKQSDGRVYIECDVAGKVLVLNR